MDKELIRVTEYCDKVFPMSHATKRAIRKNLEFAGTSLHKRAERGQRIHKELERYFLIGTYSQLGEVFNELILKSRRYKPILKSEQRLYSELILENYILEGTYDLYINWDGYYQELYDFKTYSKSNINNQLSLKKVALQQYLYSKLIQAQEDPKNPQPYSLNIVWIDLDEKDNPIQMVIYKIMIIKEDGVHKDIMKELCDKTIPQVVDLITKNKIHLRKEYSHVF